MYPPKAAEVAIASANLENQTVFPQAFPRENLVAHSSHTGSPYPQRSLALAFSTLPYAA